MEYENCEYVHERPQCQPDERTPLRGGLDQYPSFGGSQEPFQTPRRVSVMAPTLLMAIARWWVRTSTQPLGRFRKPPNYFQGENLLGGETREDIY